MAYESQSRRLREVQKRSEFLESRIREILSNAGIPIEGGRGVQVRYGDFHEWATLQADGVIPNRDGPETILFVTYTDPDKPGHSNENKLHLKMGELYLFKTYNPQLRCVLVVGETEGAWLKYVLKVFRIFFDKVVFTWEKNFRKKLLDAIYCDVKNQEFWRAEKQKRESVTLTTDTNIPSQSYFRLAFYEKVIPRYLGVKNPDEIKHPTLRRMATLAREKFVKTGGKHGTFWKHLKNPNHYRAIWQERGYFNPLEYTVSTLLDMNSYDYGSTKVQTLLQKLGMTETSSTEDFGLYSDGKNMPVYVQCKASGGGEVQHGKAVMNRSKEQIARSILYRSSVSEGHIVSGQKNYIWIAILDGKWGLPKRYPLKYIHMLQIAGYDRIFKADNLVKHGLVPNEESSFVRYLDELKCKKSSQKPLAAYL